MAFMGCTAGTRSFQYGTETAAYLTFNFLSEISIIAIYYFTFWWFGGYKQVHDSKRGFGKDTSTILPLFFN
jgi:hypothetical protein